MKPDYQSVPGHRQHILRQVMLLAVLQLLTACATTVYEPPAVIHEGAHSGGSIVAFSQSGELLASGGWEGRVRLWQLPDGQRAGGWQAHSDSVNGIAFIEDDRQVVTAGYDGLLARWSVDGVLLERIQTAAPVMHMMADTVHQRLLTGHRDGSVRVWRLPDLELLHERELHRGAVKTVAIDGGSRRYASGGSDGNVHVWSEGGTVQALEAPPADAWTLAFSPDGAWLMGGSWFRLYRWNLGDGSLRTLPTEHRGIIKSIHYLQGSNGLATISRQTDSAVYFLDPETGDTLRRFQQHDLCGGYISVSPGGRYLATTSDDASVRIWDLGLEDGKQE